jgi:hypothetical protein
MSIVVPGSHLSIAFHEAGHAVVGMAVGICPRYAVVNEACGEADYGTGEVMFEKRGPLEHMSAPYLRSRIAVDFGGGLAEARACGVKAFTKAFTLRHGSEGDALHIQQELNHLCTKDPTHRRLLYRRLAAFTDGLLVEHWRAVHQIAHALGARGRIEGTEMQKIFVRSLRTHLQ